MDFWSRFFPGLKDSPKRPAAPRPNVNDPQARLGRFRRVYSNVVEICNRPRNPSSEGPLLDSLQAHLHRIAALLREESRAPTPHTCVQFAGGNQIYAGIARAATVSQYEPVVRAAIAVFSALVDSEEQDFLASGHFAKSMMRFIQRVLDSGSIPYDSETETAVLELLFTVAARIRLQPEILPVWFHSTARPELEDVFVKGKKTFVGMTQKDDFPLCYLLMDRVHRQGRTGDFARTGLLYVFEATGRSLELEEWVVLSDLSTLMASGLGALYSQLNRELSILHPDATLPAVLAMSDYSTMHHRATAESAFSSEHKGHMATFLLYLAFWQDVLDHCRSDDVKQTLLDHFKILFLEQLLYPSLLQSSDTDAGSSIAVLTYMASMLEALEYPDLIHMILTYLLAIEEDEVSIPSAPQTPVRPPTAPRSPTSVKRRQSLMLLNRPKDPDNLVDPKLFNLVDLIINNLDSQNSQAVFAALKLSTVLFCRQRKYAFDSLLKVQKSKSTVARRTAGALELETEKYSELALSLHQQYGVDGTYQNICQDLRHVIEAQALAPKLMHGSDDDDDDYVNNYHLAGDDAFFRMARTLLRTFFTNNVDVNLALTETLVAVARCGELCLDQWLVLSPSTYRFDGGDASDPPRDWQAYLSHDEKPGWADVCSAFRRPIWENDNAPMLHTELRALALQLDRVRSQVANLDQLIAGRKNMLQASGTDLNNSETSIGIMMQNASIRQHLEVSQATQQFSGSSRIASPSRERAAQDAANHGTPPRSVNSSARASRAVSPGHRADHRYAASPPAISNLFKPPPPETPSTTDVLMQIIEFDNGNTNTSTLGNQEATTAKPKATLNHVLTNTVVLQEFVLELLAVLQVRAAVFGTKEIRNV